MTSRPMSLTSSASATFGFAAMLRSLSLPGWL